MKKWNAAEIVELNIAETARQGKGDHHDRGNHHNRGDHHDKNDHQNNPFPPTSTPLPKPEIDDSDILS